MTIIQIGVGILATIMMIIAIELTIQFGIFVVYFILSKQHNRSDLPDIIRERQHKKENVASAAAREQEKLLRERLKERYKNDIYS